MSSVDDGDVLMVIKKEHCDSLVFATVIPNKERLNKYHKFCRILVIHKRYVVLVHDDTKSESRFLIARLWLLLTYYLYLAIMSVTRKTLCLLLSNPGVCTIIRYSSYLFSGLFRWMQIFCIAQSAHKCMSL